MSLWKLLSELYSLAGKLPPELRGLLVDLIRDIAAGKSPDAVSLKAAKLAVEVAFKKGFT